MSVPETVWRDMEPLKISLITFTYLSRMSAVLKRLAPLSTRSLRTAVSWNWSVVFRSRDKLINTKHCTLPHSRLTLTVPKSNHGHMMKLIRQSIHLREIGFNVLTDALYPALLSNAPDHSNNRHYLSLYRLSVTSQLTLRT